MPHHVYVSQMFCFRLIGDITLYFNHYINMQYTFVYSMSPQLTGLAISIIIENLELMLIQIFRYVYTYMLWFLV